MILIQGKGVSRGVVKGPLYFYKKPDTTVVKVEGADLDAEKSRLEEAKKKSIEQLEVLAEHAVFVGGKKMHHYED